MCDSFVDCLNVLLKLESRSQYGLVESKSYTELPRCVASFDCELDVSLGCVARFGELARAARKSSAVSDLR